jgi:hypothetical protein
MRMRIPFLSSRGILLLLAISLLHGCEKPEVQVYDAPRDTPATPTTQQVAASMSPGSIPPPASTAALPEWTVPAGWRLKDETHALRAATFISGQGDEAFEIIVSQFPGDTGGLLANVNRWRQQIGLGPISAGDLDSQVEPFSTPTFTGHIMHLRGAQVHMLAAAIYEPAADRTWFVKATLPSALADANEEAVFDFARSFGKEQ